MKEQTLSDKRKQLRDNCLSYPNIDAIIDECDKQDKEFIKELKEEHWKYLQEEDDYYENISFNDLIDKLAGSKLI